MHWITADKIHDGHHFLPSDTCLKIDEDGTVLELQPLENLNNESVKIYKGWIVPGFVNVHCHLELSHLIGKIPKGNGLIDFVLKIMQWRNNFSENEITAAVQNAIFLSKQNGIVAIGDICNTNNTLAAKKESELYFHSFIETMGVLDKIADNRWEKAMELKNEFNLLPKKNNTNSIAPHAPYSVSNTLLNKISAAQNGKTISIHNQESVAENQFFQNKTGDFNQLYEVLKIETETIQFELANTSLQAYLKNIEDTQPLILVHNTVTNATDIQLLKERKGATYFCLCPKANLYIENKLPNISLLAESNIPICIGTDSLASNDSLSIWEELVTIKKAFPEMQWEHLIQWATFNGAKALNITPNFGEIAIGKQPRLNWIQQDMKTITPLN